MNIPRPVLVTNDDGIDAPGIRALLAAIGGEAMVVAPNRVRSGCSHAVTMESLLKVERREQGEIAISGTPADCVRLALHGLTAPPKLVVSGINEGGNLGHDVYLSGTVAAAREAAFYGLPAIAVSQYFLADTEVDWERSARLARRAIETVLARSLPQGAFWNINLPHGDARTREPEIVFCPCCTRALPLAYRADAEGFYYRRGLYHSRDRSPEADVDVCFRGDIAISMLQI